MEQATEQDIERVMAAARTREQAVLVLAGALRDVALPARSPGYARFLMRAAARTLEQLIGKTGP